MPLVLRGHKDRNSQLPDPRICELVDRARKHDDECPICYTEYENSPKLVRHTQCRHTFCAGCFILAIPNVRKCPICRGVVKKSEQLKRLEVAENEEAFQRQIERSLSKISEHLSKVGEKLTELETEALAEAESAGSSMPATFPLLSLRALLNHSQTRFARRVTQIRAPQKQMTVHRLANISRDLIEACRIFKHVDAKLRSGRDDNRSTERHFSRGCFKL